MTTSNNEEGLRGSRNNNGRQTAGRDDYKAAMTAILSELGEGKAPVLDDLKSAWGSPQANQAIRELTKQGLAGVHRRRVHKADGDQYRFGVGRIAQKGPGRFLMVMDDGQEAYLTAKSSRTVAHGDKIRAFLATEPDSDTEALPVALVERDMAQEHIARAKTLASGEVAFFLDGRVEDVRLSLPAPGAVAGDLWRCTLHERGLFRDSVAAVGIEKIGNEADKGIETKLAFMTRFSPDAACDEAQWPNKYSLSDSVDSAARRDIRGLPLATIDGETTSDFDDAICAKRKGEGWEIVVAIADVSAFVPEGSALDAFAMKKMTSVYLPHQVHPMLPRSISTGVCSLNPGEDRLALCCELQVDADGKVASFDFFRATMASHARLTYASAQAFLDGAGSLGSVAVDESVRSLSEAAKAMRDFGFRAGRLDMGDDELSFVFDEHGKIKELKSSSRLWTHKIVEDCMLAANCAAAAHVEKNSGTGIFRNHLGVKADSLAGVHETLEALGLKVGDGVAPITQGQIASALENAKAMGKYAQARSAILGAMSSANYETENHGHFSLVAKQYCHFTSPIRRYPDLMVHRMIKAAIDAKPSPYTRDQSHDLAQKASGFSQLSSQAENEARKLLVLNYAEKFKGESFDARLSTIGERGVWVALPLGGASLDFFVGAKPLKEAGLSWSEADFAWSGADKKPLVEGDILRCKVMSIDHGARRLELAPEPAIVLESKPAGARP